MIMPISAQQLTQIITVPLALYVFLYDGRIVAQIRNHNKPDVGTTLQSESTDGGKTWTVP